MVRNFFLCIVRMIAIVPTNQKAMPRHKSKYCRSRNIRWEICIDQIASDLAFEKKLKGGVSELITRLVIAESKRKRGIAHLHNPSACSRPGAVRSSHSK